MKKQMIAILGTGILMIVISLFTGCSGKRTLDFKQIADFEFSGLDGKGTVSVTINDDIYDDNDFLKKLFPDSSRKKAKEKLSEMMDTVEYNFSDNDNLSNGDEVSVDVEYDKKLFDNKEVKVQNTTFNVKVAGLSQGTKIDVFEGLNISYEGMSGRGYAIFSTENSSEFVKNYVVFGYSETDLSNGDKITVTASYSKEDADNNLIVIENDTKEYTVSGLKEPVNIDPFEKLEITYTGASPYLTASIDSTKCDDMVNQYIRFEIESGFLKNGDKFTVTAVYNEYDAEENGFVVKNNSKSYTVEKQPEYISSLDGLNLKDLQSEINDKLDVVTATNEGSSSFADEYIYNKCGSFKSIASESLKSEYIISLKPNFEDKFNTGWNELPYNRYIKIYEYILNGDGDEQAKVYVLIYVDNIQKESDGTISWDIELNYKCSSNYNDLINDNVTSEKEYYNVSEIKDKTE